VKRVCGCNGKISRYPGEKRMESKMMKGLESRVCVRACVPLCVCVCVCSVIPRAGGQILEEGREKNKSS
jgi:hypothetical protein